MPNYRKMYAVVCADASEAIDLLQEGRPTEAEQMLRRALSRAEELYITAPEGQGEVISLFPSQEE